MRWIRRVLALSLFGLLLAAGGKAQQIPVMGCRAALNCGYKGFSTLLQSAGEGHTLFGVSLWVSGGKLKGRPALPAREQIDQRAIDAAVDLFVRRHALRKPQSSATTTEPEGETSSPDSDSSPR